MPPKISAQDKARYYQKAVDFKITTVIDVLQQAITAYLNSPHKGLAHGGEGDRRVRNLWQEMSQDKHDDSARLEICREILVGADVKGDWLQGSFKSYLAWALMALYESATIRQKQVDYPMTQRLPGFMYKTLPVASCGNKLLKSWTDSDFVYQTISRNLNLSEPKNIDKIAILRDAGFIAEHDYNIPLRP